MRVAVLLAFAAAVAVSAPAAARPARTFSPAGTRLALELPAGWHETKPGRGWRFEAVAPRGAGWVFLSAVPAVVTAPSFERSLIAFERAQARRLGPRVTVRVRRATVGSARAVEIYAAGRGTNAQYVYGFQHSGLEYVLVFATTSARLATERAAFAASVRSVRFLGDAP